MSDLTPEQARKLHRSAEPFAIDPAKYLAPPDECRLCAHVPEIDGPEPPLRFASKFCPIHGLGTEWRAAALADLAETGLAEARVLRLRPGDIVVLHFPDDALIDVTEVRNTLTALLPDGVTALILADDMEVSRITPATEDEDGEGIAGQWVPLHERPEFGAPRG